MQTVLGFPDLGPLVPELILTGAALVIVLLDLVIKRKETLAFLSIIFAAIAAYTLFNSVGSTFGGMFVSDGYSIFFKIIFLLNLVLSILVSVKYISIEKINLGEYYGFMLFATLGMMIMASSGDFMSLYLGLELMALSVYVLAGFMRRSTKSNEAALKYFLLGAFASALLLFGISIIYGLTGTTDLNAVAGYISEKGLAGNPALMLSIILIAGAFSFKIAAAPFHMWAPDVYEGAPTSVTAFMSIGPKAAGFAVLGRVFLVAFDPAKIDWLYILTAIAILTMATGNIIALVQTNIKRMLAYSSIAHAGYALIGVIVGGPEGVASMMNYLLIYAFMNMGAFAIVILLRTEGFAGDKISDYEGLSKAHPGYAALMLLFMFSLTGIPPTAGFIGKLYVFMSAVNAGYTWLVVIAVFFSAISAYFYLRIVMYMYMKDPKAEVEIAASPSLNLALTVSALAVLLIGILPSGIIGMARFAASAFK
jgi:NADH-quinone oxidoreductase subunit N